MSGCAATSACFAPSSGTRAPRIDALRRGVPERLQVGLAQRPLPDEQLVLHPPVRVAPRGEVCSEVSGSARAIRRTSSRSAMPVKLPRTRRYGAVCVTIRPRRPRVGSLRQRRHFDRVPTDYGDPDADQLLHDDVAEDLPFTRHGTHRLPGGADPLLRPRGRRCAGARLPQVVVVGAGYDGRSLRYSNPGVRWFELDHPATLADKSARVDRLGLVADEVAAVGVDFSVDDVDQALADAGHDAERMSLLICEGVTPYLERDGHRRAVAQSLAAERPPGSRLAIDFPLEPESAEARAVPGGPAGGGRGARRAVPVRGAEGAARRVCCGPPAGRCGGRSTRPGSRPRRAPRRPRS